MKEAINKTSEQNRLFVKMVDNAIKVLDELKNSQEPMGVNELAKSCELNPSTAFRILKTMELCGWVYQLSDNRYIPGEKLSFETSENSIYLSLQAVSAVIMENYAKRYNYPMNLMVLEGNYCLILQQARTRNLIDYVSPRYSKIPFYSSASGKILLSELPVEEIDDILKNTEMKPLTLNTICDPEEFRKVLEETKENGYSFDIHESSLVGSAVAVAIRNPRGKIVASLSFCGIIGLEDRERLSEFVPVLKQAAEAISNSMDQVEMYLGKNLFD